MITDKVIVNYIRYLYRKASSGVPPDVINALKEAYKSESNETAKYILNIMIESALLSHEKEIVICQDTGLPLFFIDIGTEVDFKCNFKKIINTVIRETYKKVIIGSLLLILLVVIKNLLLPGIIFL